SVGSSTTNFVTLASPAVVTHIASKMFAASIQDLELATAQRMVCLKRNIGFLPVERRERARNAAASDTKGLLERNRFLRKRRRAERERLRISGPCGPRSHADARTPILVRRHAQRTSEGTGKMALVRKSAAERDVGDR